MYLNWSFLIVVFALGLIGIWVAYSFLNKNGLYLFGIISTLLCGVMEGSSFFSLPISISIALMPLVYFALLTCLNKYGNDEAKKLFLISLISMVSLFAFNFFQACYVDAMLNTQQALSWAYLGNFVSQIVAFVIASALTLFLTNKIKIKNIKKFLLLGIYIAIASSIYSTVFSIFFFTGTLSFVKILLIILLEIVIVCLISLFLGYFEKFLNREPKKEKQAETIVIKTENKNQENAEDLKTPEDID